MKARRFRLAGAIRQGARIKERIERLNELWTEGLSAGQIAAELGEDVSLNKVGTFERQQLRSAKFWRLPRVEHAGGICASEPEVADDPERPCREAEASVQGRFQRPALSKRR